ncbi:hypothetical protein ACFV9C_35960 [Kribbella sp. NPDC059898]|uniref:hypothetical protein n=1 Tax=Kribbella sp. NPDC059898 TaxID=3346995 RepID=UPI003650360F
MRDIEVRDILVLARAELSDPQADLKQLYLWRYEYLATAAKAVVGAGASLLVAVLAAALQHKDGADWRPVIGGAIGAVLVLATGVFTYQRIRRIYREYVIAQELLSEAIRVQPFLRLYEAREQSTDD